MAGFLSRAELETLVKGALRSTVIAGGLAGDHTVSGIAPGDQLRAVLSLDVAQADHLQADIVGALADHAAHGHAIPADTSGTTVVAEINAAGLLAVGAGGAVQDAAAMAHGAGLAAVAHSRTWSVADLTAEFSISGADTINNAGGTDTTGRVLLVVWEDWTP